MKNTLIAAIIAITATFSAPVHAKIVDPAADEYCLIIADLAEMIMRFRQDGMSMTAAIDITDSNLTGSLHEIGRGFIIITYNYPRHAIPESREWAVAEFRDDMHINCYNVIGSM